MSEAVTFKQQLRVIGPDGTQLLLAAARLMNIADVFNSDTAVMTAGEAARIDLTNAIIGAIITVPLSSGAPGALPSNYPVEEEEKVLRVSAATNVCWAGVALDTIGINKTGRVAGAGSVIAVQCLTAPTSVSFTNGSPAVIGSATAGKVDSVSAASAGGSATPAGGGGGSLLGRLVRTPAQMSPGGADTTFGYMGIIVGHP